jgi:uncharacterized protein YbgA (DUF1722 family)/uncharacterized protein YbbK (DUF523 family)
MRIAMDDQIKLGVSACLLGNKVRYNGGHSRDSFVADTLSQYVAFFPVCPEVESGFPVPRETMRLEGDPESPRLVTTRTRQDHTDRMKTWCEGKVKELEELDLYGFIFRKGSPSSGMERVKVYSDKGVPSPRGIGMFARAFMERFPLLPVEEDGRLHDPGLRENFIEAIFVLKRWRQTLAPRPTRRGFVEFHTQHKLLVMAHSPSHMRQLGKMVAEIKNYPLEEFREQYQRLLVEALRFKATRRKQTDVLMHAMGFLKKLLSGDEKKELLEIIEQYRQGYLPLIVPVTLLNHYVRKYEPSYLKDQYYLKPHPIELQLRNHA